MTKQNSVYRVEFKIRPDEESKELPVRFAEIKVLGMSINDAENNAWKAVTLDPNEYEIVSVCMMGRNFRGNML